MQVTRANFAEASASALAAINGASFVAIDCEMTGLWTAPWLSGSPIDSLDSRWSRVRDSGVHMGLLQFGVCPFTWDAATGSYAARPFSFYLLPRESPIGASDGVPGTGGDSVFHASSATLEFLRKHHFDWHTLIDGGVTFLSREGEARQRHVGRLSAMRKHMRAQESAEGEAAAAAATAAAGASSSERRAPTRIVIEAALPSPPTSTLSGLAGTVATLQVSVAGDAATLPQPVAPAPAPPAEAAAAPLAASAGDELRLSRPADIEWYHSIMGAVEQWVEGIEQWREGNAPESLNLETFSTPPQAPGGVAADAAPASYPFLLFPPANGFKRKVIWAVLEGRFGIGSASPIKCQTRPSDQPAGGSDWDKTLRVTWVGEGTKGCAAWQAFEVSRAVNEVDALLTDAVGFRHIIEAISASRVPVVGHNCWLDLAHTTAKFIGSPAPALPEWAAQLATLFPTVYDTKHLLTLSESEGAPDPVIAAAFRNQHGLSQAYRVVRASAPVTVVLPKVAPTVEAAAAPPAAGGGAPMDIDATAPASAVAAAPTAPTPAIEGVAAAVPPPAAAPKRWQGGSRGSGGAGGSGAPSVDKVTITVDWPSLVPIHLAVGFDGADAAAAALADKASAAAAVSGVVVADNAAVMTSPTAAAPAPPPSDVGDEALAHDAGFDAYMTGVVFARVASRLASLPGQTAAEDAHTPFFCDPRTSIVAPLPPADLHSAIITPPIALRSLRNSLHVMRTRSGRLFKTLNLEHARELAGNKGGAAAAADAGGAASSTNTLLASRALAYRACYIHVSHLDTSVRSDDLAACLGEALAMDAKNIEKNITWVDDRSAFVALPSFEHAIAAVKAAEGGAAPPSAAVEPVGGDYADAHKSGGAAGGILQWIVRKVTGEPGGDNMLGLGAGDDALPPPATAVSAAAAAAAPSYDLAALPASAITPELAARLARRPHLSAFTVRTYAQWLAQHADIFGDTCAHEVVPRVYATAMPTEGGGGGGVTGGGSGGGVAASAAAAAAAAAAAVVAAARGVKRMRSSEGGAEGDAAAAAGGEAATAPPAVGSVWGSIGGLFK